MHAFESRLYLSRGSDLSSLERSASEVTYGDALVASSPIFECSAVINVTSLVILWQALIDTKL